MGHYSIKDVEQLTGIKAHTIRIWEQRYQTIQPHRTDTNIRYYDDDQLRFLINVSLLMKYGKKVSHIFSYNDEELKWELKNLNPGMVSEDKFAGIMIDGLVASMIDLDETSFNKTLNKSIIKYGFEKAMLYVVIPFLERVGLLWAINDINVAQEHFMSNLIRRKLVVAIDAIVDVPVTKHKFLLFLPEGEFHEIGLLFAHYLISVRGHQVVYIGQSIPLRDLVDIDKVYHPDYLVTYFTIRLDDDGVGNWIKDLKKYFPKRKICCCGPVLDNLFINSTKIIKLKTVQDMVNLLDALPGSF